MEPLTWVLLCIAVSTIVCMFVALFFLPYDEDDDPENWNDDVVR